MPLNIDIQQILLHMFNFIILGGGLYLLLYKPVKDFMDKRVESYEKMEKDARLILQEAEDKKIEYEEKIAGVENEIKEMRSVAQREIDTITESQIESAKKEADQIIKVAKINSEREKQKAIDEAKEEITKLAIDATRKLVKKEEDSYRSFVEAAKVGEEHE